MSLSYRIIHTCPLLLFSTDNYLTSMCEIQISIYTLLLHTVMRLFFLSDRERERDDMHKMI